MNTGRFDETQIFSIGTALDRGNLPVKWVYITEAGEISWTEIETERSKAESSFIDAGMFEKGVEAYLRELGNPEKLIMIDIGGGAGITVEPIIRKLQEKSVEVQYGTIDISGEMIKRCRRRLESFVPFIGYVMDIDDGGVGQKIREIKVRNPNTPVLVSILGSTVGNFPDAKSLVKQIEMGLGLKDRVIIGGQLYQAGQENSLVNLYREDERASILQNATLVSLGIDFKGRSDFRWNEQEAMVEGFIRVGEDYNFSLGGQRIHYAKGDEIRLLETRKFDLERFIQIRGGMRIASILTDARARFCQAMYAPYRR